MFNKKITRSESTIIKGSAVLMLVHTHLFTSTVRWQYFESVLNIGINPLAALLTIPSQVVISVFLFITGYGLFQCYEKIKPDSLRQRYLDSIKRIKKLYVIYWFVFLITAMILLAGGMWNALYVESGEMILDILGLAYLFDTGTLNGSWWYMLVLLIAYLISPVLYGLVKKYPKSVFLGENIVVLIFFRAGKSGGGYRPFNQNCSVGVRYAICKW